MASLVSDRMSKEQLQAERFRYVKYLWHDEVADKLTGVDRLENWNLLQELAGLR